MMNKRALLAFALSLLVIVSYNYLMSRKYPAPVQEPVAAREVQHNLPYAGHSKASALLPERMERSILCTSQPWEKA